MPLIGAIAHEPELKQARVQRRFDELPQDDRTAVLNLVEAGRRGEVIDRVQLSERANELIRMPEFKEIYEDQTKPEPPPQNHLGEMIRGLMDIIRAQQQNKQVGPGELNPEVVDGGAEASGSGFKDKLAGAFESGGAPGLAVAHRELIKGDKDYNTFLKGK